MNRIYQGRVTSVQIANGNPKAPKDEQWLPFDQDPVVAKKKWEGALWQHHELFQDAVNYYTLALAALAEGLTADTAQGDAALKWRAQVRENWLDGRRRALRYDGPHKRLASLLGVDADITDEHAAFEASAKVVLRSNGSSATQRASALLQLFEEAESNDLNQLCVNRLRWFCTRKGELAATPRNVVAQQEVERIRQARAVHAATAGTVADVAAKLEPGRFVTQMPSEFAKGEIACDEAVKQFKSAAQKVAALGEYEAEFTAHLAKLGDALRVPQLGRKPSGLYPFALVLHLWPTLPAWDAFKHATRNLVGKEEPAIAGDAIAEARTDDEPLFEYFTNRAFFREQGNETHAVWFEFDLAAFLEAIKTPHRYYQDTQSRGIAVRKLREKLHFIDPSAGWLKDVPTATEAKKAKKKASTDSEQESGPDFTFAGDPRIARLRVLVSDTLGYLAEAEAGETIGGKEEYSIQERTLRGWSQIREAWRKRVARGAFTPEDLWKEVVEIQGEHRDDFGSATLYLELTKPENQCLWLDAPPQEGRHADDPLRAWMEYTELRFELKDRSRDIRLTPAHAQHSPRYYVLPKSGRLGTEHEAAKPEDRELHFTAGVICRTARGLEPSMARLEYSAPRLRRDELRAPGESDLAAAHWLQPMMQALGIPNTDTQDFAKCRVTLQPAAPSNHQLTFPVEIDSSALQKAVGLGGRWARQFNLHPDGEEFYDASLRWPHEKQPAKPPVNWFEQTDAFTTLAVDLGQRDAGAYALLDVRANDDFNGKPTRLIGETGEGTAKKTWRAALGASGMLRLSGEDRTEWRDATKTEQAKGLQGFAWREELFGERGRSATKAETNECIDLLVALGAREAELMPPEWRSRLSFPEQNDKLLVAARRAQSRVARLHRWVWFLADAKHTGRIKKACEEIADVSKGAQDDSQAKFAVLEKAGDIDALRTALRDELIGMQLGLPGELVKIANRVLPLRGRSWRWQVHPVKDDCHLLDRTGPIREDVLLRGQRGLTLERIEQVEELRKRFQSLNQSLRRVIGGKAPLRRDDSIPDPCPDLLEKLDRLKTQRVNQTAHMILAQALGVQLRAPDKDKARLRVERDQHGQYEKFRAPADFVVIEDLSRYRASQGRAPRENSRLMKWNHRAIRDKLKELCEPFGLPVVETPAAWSSRFCARSGVPGFRAVEIHPGLRYEHPWAWQLKRWADFQKTADTLDAKERAVLEEKLGDARRIAELFVELDHLNRAEPANAERPKWRTLYAPMAGGPIFVPLCARIAAPDHTKLQPAIVQSDINAAINLALRAIADPRLWAIHPRLRTQREGKGGAMLAREKRKYGAKKAPAIMLTEETKLPENDNRQPNFFFDRSGVVEWGSASVEDPVSGQPVSIVSGMAMWKTVREAQWRRCHEINQARIARWNRDEPVPGNPEL